ncbi:MAG: hypothetical protein P4L35_12420 [Ignavibacteriaceae bacterium]|nr:hypothetical protein [Ignavibacteriaceae bacterium]
MDNWNGIVSLLIACIELVLIINILVFAEKNKFNNISTLFLIILMIYQALEFIMCHLGYSTSFMAYLAFIDISFLPPLDLYLIYTYFNKKNDNLKYLFVIPFFFIIYYAFVLNKFEIASCAAFYAVYNYPLGTLFGAYYYLPIAASVFFLISYLRKGTAPKKILFAGLLLTGHIIMALPVLFAFLLASLRMPGMLNSVESIMCKFAFSYALCLAFFALNNKESVNE